MQTCKECGKELFALVERNAHFCLDCMHDFRLLLEAVVEDTFTREEISALNILQEAENFYLGGDAYQTDGSYHG